MRVFDVGIAFVDKQPGRLEAIVAYFEEQRREMIAAIKVIAEPSRRDWQDRAGRSGPQGDG